MDEAFFEEVVRESEARLADPLPFAMEALEDLFLHESDKEQGFRRYQSKLESFFWWADDAVRCLEKVLAAPPDNLGALVREHAGAIWAGDEIGDDAAHVAWLRATTERLRSQFDAFVAERS
jgi:hypothetical protein